MPYNAKCRYITNKFQKHVSLGLREPDCKGLRTYQIKIQQNHQTDSVEI